MTRTLHRAALPAALVLGAVCAAPATARAQQDEISDADRYFEQGEYARAGESYNQIIDEYGISAGCGVYSKRAAVYALTRDYAAGQSFIATAPTQCRTAPEVLEQKALLLWAMGQRKQAVEVAEDVVTRRPAAFSNQKILGEYYSRRDPAKAVTAYRAYLRYRPSELSSTDATPRVLFAFSLLAVASNGDRSRQKGLLGEARRQLEVVDKSFAGNREASVNAQNGLCAVYTALGDWNRAVTVCERVVKDSRTRDPRTSAWYNLSLAYLANRQPRQARSSALEFVKRGGEQDTGDEQGKGYELVGDSYFAERRWPDALRYYLIAEQRVSGKPAVGVSTKVGLTYRKLGRYKEAVERLQTAWKASGGSPQVAVELGEAHNALGQHAEAAAVCEPLIAKSGKDDPALLIVAGDAELGQKRTEKARSLFEKAFEANSDARARRGIIQSFNLEAHQALTSNKTREAHVILTRALKYDNKSIQTNKNLAVLAIELGQCKDAMEHLGALRELRSQQVAYHRLSARASLCLAEPDLPAALKLYEKGAQLAREAGNNLALAEIYTEWAPLTFKSDLDGAVQKLSEAVQFSFGVSEIAGAARQNRARALYLRGVERLTKGDGPAARADLEAAASESKNLSAGEFDSIRLALALAHAESGGSKAALDIIASLGPNPRGLQRPFTQVKPQFFAAYARYRSNSAGEVTAAAKAFTTLSRSGPQVARKLARELAGNAYMKLAAMQYRSGNSSRATASLNQADKFLDDARKERVMRHNRLVLRTPRGQEGKARAQMATLQDNPVEALVNLGIAYDAAGDGRRAYQLWQQARTKGYRSRVLDAWLEAKQRIFGYGNGN